jgi:Transglutaminase-like superfamily
MTLEDAPLGSSFAVLAASPCAPYDETLTAIEREFRAVDRGWVADALDRLARPLFGLTAAPPRERSHALAGAAFAALPEDGGDPPSWLLSRALEDGRAAPAIRAVVAVELARRAGVSARPVRLRGRWLVGVHAGGAPVAADTGPDDAADAWDACMGCLCAHEVAFCALGGLAAAWRAVGEDERARRAAGLRLLLPLADELRSAVREDVTRFGRAR